MTKTVTMEVVSKEKQMAVKNEERQKMVDLLTAKIADAEKSLQTKKYIIEGGLAIADSITMFLTEKAAWKFSESLGIMESVKQVEEATKAINTGKVKELFVPSLALEAIYYFLTKVEGKGLAEAKSYIEVLKPVSDALGRSKADREVIDQLIRDQATLESAIDGGADLENEDAILTEIQNELAKEI